MRAASALRSPAMCRVLALGLAILAVCFCMLPPRAARAAPPATQTTLVYVLTIWTDDADDAADALTQALRAQVRSSPGWSLVDSTQSFETLAIALRCPPKPDPACLQRIGDQLHAGHYVWGTVARHKGTSEVEADVHLWARGRPSIDTSGTFADSVKDGSDPALRSIASRMWEELQGTTPPATLVVHAGAAGGTVVVDGDERETLRAGVARVTVTAGEHTVAVRVPGFRAAPQTASVAARAERDVEFTLAPIPASAQATTQEPTHEAGRGAPVQRILGYSAIVVGAGLLVAAGVEAANWMSDKNASDADRANVPNTVPNVCDYQSSPAQDACQKGKDAKTASVLGWVFAGAGVALAGTGTWLVLSDSGADSSHREARRTVTAPTVRIVPELGLRTQAIAVRVSF
jgi:hypothetical protein